MYGSIGAFGTFALGALTAVLSAWNAYQNLKIGKMMLELRLNIMREMNGKYERVDNAKDLKRRIERLENKALSGGH